MSSYCVSAHTTARKEPRGAAGVRAYVPGEARLQQLEAEDAQTQETSHEDCETQGMRLFGLRQFKITNFSRTQESKSRISFEWCALLSLWRVVGDREGTERHLQREDWREGWQVGEIRNLKLFISSILQNDHTR